jgi:hypothetical protein
MGVIQVSKRQGWLYLFLLAIPNPLLVRYEQKKPIPEEVFIQRRFVSLPCETSDLRSSQTYVLE